MTTLLILAIVAILGYWLFWPLIAFIVSRAPVARWLIDRSLRTPYFHLDGYMHRWWLFNPIETLEVRRTSKDIPANLAPHLRRFLESIPVGGTKTLKKPRYRWCPVSARIHHILRADKARHPHNHPGSFRTIVLDGWYDETRDDGIYTRHQGDTAVLEHGEFHHVNEVSIGGVWTLFIMWDWRGVWGFRLDDGSVVPHQEYHNGGKP